MSLPLQEHWNKKYTDTPITQLGWYEAISQPSVVLIENCAVLKQSAVMDVGSGTSILIANLLDLGYRNLYAVDISSVALEKAKAQLGQERAALVHWIVDDITNPSTVLQHLNVAVWHDRAVFHFLTEEQDRQTYHSLLQKIVMPGGFVVIATFAMNGATRCSGLPVQRYSTESLNDFMGEDFRPLENLDYTYQMPSGDLRPYVYARFQKI
jgi:EEF1A lysine methyltransferase 2